MEPLPAAQRLSQDAEGAAPRAHRPLVFDKMEALVREMQEPATGVPVRSQKLFLTAIPAAFMGYDLIEWLMERLNIEDSMEALHLANLLCQHGYYFPVGDSKALLVKDDSSLYRFQTPYYWPSQVHSPDNLEYAIYLAKRSLRNKQKHALEDHEIEALNQLRRSLAHKWDFVTMQADEQVRLAKERKKGDKIVTDSQERAFWRVYRPPPGFLNCLESPPVPPRPRPDAPDAIRRRQRTKEELRREVELLRTSLGRTRQKTSQAMANSITYCENYAEHDPFLNPSQPSNPWHTDDCTFWTINAPLVDMPTEKRVKRWAMSMEELVNDPTGLQEFTNYLRKEYSHENIRFWLAVNDLRRGGHVHIARKVKEIFEEFLAAGAPCEINIDGKTMEKVQSEMTKPTRYTFEAAAEHVYALLLKKDCYPRFIRSEQYRVLLANALQPSQKKRFFSFGAPLKKKASTSAAPPTGVQTSGTQAMRRRGSDKSLMGSAQELGSPSESRAIARSHSQSNLAELECDIPYSASSQSAKGAAGESGASEDQAAAGTSGNEVCPWESHAKEQPVAAAAAALPSQQQQANQVKQQTAAAVAAAAAATVESQQKAQQSSSSTSAAAPSQQRTSPSSCPTGKNDDVCPWDSSQTPQEPSSEIAPSCAPPQPLQPINQQHVRRKSSGSTINRPTRLPPPATHRRYTQPEVSFPRGSLFHCETIPSSPPSPPPPSSPPRRKSCQPLVVIGLEDDEDDDDDMDDGASTILLLEMDHKGLAPCDIVSADIEASLVLRDAPLATPEPGTPPEELLTNLAEEEMTSQPVPSTSAQQPQQQQPMQRQSSTAGERRRSSRDRKGHSSDRRRSSARSSKKDKERGLPTEADIGEEKSSAGATTVQEVSHTDICPWEDEEKCKMDAPFVKTYATLGYF